MIKKTIRLVPYAFFLSACSPFVPQEGLWTAGNLEKTEGTCDSDTEETEETEETEDSDNKFTLTLTDDGFKLVDDEDVEGEEPLVCTLSGKNFTCENGTPQFIEEETWTVTMTFEHVGSFASSTEMTMNTTTSLTCEGEGCDSLTPAMPCTTGSSITATADE